MLWPGHRRLAVVDLSHTGHQPLVSTDGRLVIVFNGEIYNHGKLRAELTPPGSWKRSSEIAVSRYTSEHAVVEWLGFLEAIAPFGHPPNTAHAQPSEIYITRE